MHKYWDAVTTDIKLLIFKQTEIATYWNDEGSISNDASHRIAILQRTDMNHGLVKHKLHQKTNFIELSFGVQLKKIMCGIIYAIRFHLMNAIFKLLSKIPAMENCKYYDWASADLRIVRVETIEYQILIDHHKPNNVRFSYIVISASVF